MPIQYIQGDDPPADPATKSYFSNHVSFMVSDLVASRQWYSDVLGMRHIFTFELSSDYSIMYMGHSQGGKNGTGYQSGREMARDKTNMTGLIELVWYRKAAQRNFAPSSGSTFSHIGLVVENLAAAEKRFDAMNVNIVKRPGAMDTSAETADAAFAAAFGFADLSNEETLKDFAAILPGLKANGFVDHVLMIKDPDGNLIEVMPQNERATA